MINRSQALDFLGAFIKDENIIIHSHCVSLIASSVATKINCIHPELCVNAEKLSIAGLLHDVGKSLDGQHELNTIGLLKNNGHKEIADICMHGFLYELNLIKGISNPNLLPTSLENKILVLSDMYCKQNGMKVTIDERFDDILKRYAKDQDFIAAAELARHRMKSLEKEILALI